MIAAVIVPTMSILVKHFELGLFTEVPISLPSVVKDVPAEASVVPASSETQTEEYEGVTKLELIEAGSGGANITWRPILLYGWMIVILVLLGRLFAAFFSGLCLLRRAQSRGCEQIQRAADFARARLGITKDLRVRSSKDIRSPVIWCWSTTPVLLVPGDLDDRVDWEGVISHELAHWRRLDHVSGLIAELIACILSWNPLLWWSKKRMVRLSEQACDDWVLASGRPCEDYAQSLLNFKPQKQAAFVPAVVHSKRGLAARVRRILQDSCGNPRTGALWALSVSIVMACLAFGVACAQTRPAEPASAPAQEKATAAPTARDKATATAALFQAMSVGDYRARKAEDIALVKSAIAQGADLEAKNNRGRTPLHIAVRQSVGLKQKHEMLRLLLEAGANPNVRDPKGQTPLHLVVRDWHVSLVRLLVAAGSDVNARDNKGMRPVMIAFEQGQTDMFDLMVANGAMVPNDFMAAYKGDLTPVQRLIESGKAQETFEQGLTLLHAAAAGGHTQIVDLLLANGSDVHSQTQAGYTALHYAVAGNHRQLAELLLANGADINAEPGKQTPLHWAVRHPKLHKEMIEWLVARGANPNADGGGWATPLHWAIWCGDVSTAVLLVAHGGDIHLETEEYPDSPLYDAIWNSDRTMTEALVTKAGDARAAKWAPLHATVVTGDIQAIEDLLAKGADVNARDEDGYTALFIAALRGHKEVVELLLAKGADINARLDVDARGAGGWTSLHAAARHDRKSVAQLLIAKGADVNAKTEKGQTALSLAKENGHTKIVELLIKHGAKE
jgi:cytohesin